MSDKQIIELILSSLNHNGYCADRRNVDLMITQILIDVADMSQRLAAISEITDLNEDPNICSRFKNDLYAKDVN